MVIKLEGGGRLLPDSAPRIFHLLAKPTGAICNLDCTYCFFLSKELLYPGSRFRMAEELLEEYLSQLIEAHAGAREVIIAWQGGEPTLMGLDFFRRSVELADRYRRRGQKIVHTIQTNGTLVDDPWAAFFAENHFLVGLSIDGPGQLHDAYRVDKGGKGSFDRVMAGLAALRRHGVDWNVLCTVHAANEGHGREIYQFLRDDCGARYMQFIPIVERAAAASLVSEQSVSADGYGRFLIDVFEDWVRRDIGEIYVQMFDVALANWYGQPPGLCVHSETCGLALALEHNGDVYSCDHYVEPAYRLGNISESRLLDLVALPQQKEFGLAKRDSLPQYCLDCEVRFACHGGCPKDRFAVTPDGQPGLHYLCPSYKAFFGHIEPVMRQMCDLLKSDRAPSELVGRYAAQDARRGRNDPCSCGSGRKWKHCHQAQPSPG